MTSEELKRTAFYLLNIVVPLASGLIIYLSFRPESYLSSFAESAGISIQLNSFKPGILYLFIKNYFSDILWAYSLTFAVAFVLGYSRRNLVLTVIICLLFSAVLESFQRLGIFNGTFDVLDIAFEGLSTVLSAALITYYEEKKT